MTYLIAEIGINHNGSIQTARELINAASRAGVDAVKFQYRNLDNGLSKFGYEIGDEILDAEIRRNYLSPQSILELAKYAKELRLEVGISFFDVRDIDDFIELIEIFDFFKIPSVEFSNKSLADKLEKFRKKILYSTGACSETQIRKFSQRKIDPSRNILLHCVSNYPVETHNANLGYINWLKSNYKFPVGYSSHDANFLVCLVAIGHGIEYLERHITLDKSMSGLDHTSSSNEEEFSILAEFCKNSNSLNDGFGQRKINQGELLNRQNLGRSYYAKKNIKAGSYIHEEDFEYRSPMVGLDYDEFQMTVNKPLFKSINLGECLGINHLRSACDVSEEKIEFCIKQKIAVPVRLHDVKKIMNILPVKNYELHLSFGEVFNKLSNFNVVSGCKYSIHLPDYVSATRLINPFSLDLEVREKTKKMIELVIHLAKKIEDQTGENVPLVASFSNQGMNPLNFYSQLLEFINSVKLNNGVEILPQWLPPIAWYFGGSIKLDVFNDDVAVNFLIENNLPYCLDTSHYFMCLNSNMLDDDKIDLILPLAKHFHISGASGVDGEGVNFSNLAIQDLDLFKKVIFSDKRKVIEVWQGHLEEYRGFCEAINDIHKIWG